MEATPAHTVMVEIVFKDRFGEVVGRRVTAEGRCRLPTQIKHTHMKYACSVQVCKSLPSTISRFNQYRLRSRSSRIDEHHCKKRGLH